MCGDIVLEKRTQQTVPGFTFCLFSMHVCAFLCRVAYGGLSMEARGGCWVSSLYLSPCSWQTLLPPGSTTELGAPWFWPLSAHHRPLPQGWDHTATIVPESVAPAVLSLFPLSCFPRLIDILKSVWIHILVNWEMEYRPTSKAGFNSEALVRVP